MEKIPMLQFVVQKNTSLNFNLPLAEAPRVPAVGEVVMHFVENFPGGGKRFEVDSVEWHLRAGQVFQVLVWLIEGYPKASKKPDAV